MRYVRKCAGMLLSLMVLSLIILPVKTDAAAVAPKILSFIQTDSTGNSITVTWNLQDAANVEVWVRDHSTSTGTDGYQRRATVNTSSYTIGSLAPDKEYDVMIVAINGEDTKLRTTRVLYAAKTKLGGIQNVWQTAWDEESNTITLGWDRIVSADGYEYWLENAKESKSLIKETMGNANAKPTVTLAATKGKIYKFSVRAFTYVQGKNEYTEWKSIWCIASPKVESAVLSGGKLTVKWSKVKGAGGYEVYVSSKPHTGYKKVKSVGKKQTSLKIKKVGSKKISSRKKWYVCVLSKKGDSKSGATVYYDTATKGMQSHEFPR